MSAQQLIEMSLRVLPGNELWHMTYVTAKDTQEQNFKKRKTSRIGPLCLCKSNHYFVQKPLKTPTTVRGPVLIRTKMAASSSEMCPKPPVGLWRACSSVTRGSSFEVPGRLALCAQEGAGGVEATFLEREQVPTFRPFQCSERFPFLFWNLYVLLSAIGF